MVCSLCERITYPTLRYPASVSDEQAYGFTCWLNSSLTLEPCATQEEKRCLLPSNGAHVPQNDLATPLDLAFDRARWSCFEGLANQIPSPHEGH